MLKKMLTTLLFSFVFFNIAFTKEPVKEASTLFTQTARYATLQKDDTRSGWYKLVLHDVNPKTLWFTDRPERQGGVISTEKFIASWPKGKDSFKKENPNASIVSVDMSTGNINKEGAFRLQDPEYNTKTRVLTYSIKGISDMDKSFEDQKDFHEVALFIDSYCYACVVE